MPQEPEYWVVVCHDLHAVFGIFGSERDATVQAAGMTADPQDDCQYKPVRMAVIFDGQHHGNISDDDSHPGHYL